MTLKSKWKKLVLRPRDKRNAKETKKQTVSEPKAIEHGYMNAYDSEGRSAQSSSEEEAIPAQQLQVTSVDAAPPKPVRKIRPIPQLPTTKPPVEDASGEHVNDDSNECVAGAASDSNPNHTSEFFPRKMPHRYARRKFNNSNVKMTFGSTPDLRSPIDVFTRENIYENVMSTFGTPNNSKDISSTPNLCSDGLYMGNVLSTFMTPKAHRKHDGYSTDNELSSRRNKRLQRTLSSVSLPGKSDEPKNIFEQNSDDDYDLYTNKENDRGAPSTSSADVVSNNSTERKPSPRPRRKHSKGNEGAVTQEGCALAMTSLPQSTEKEASQQNTAAAITSEMLATVKLRPKSGRATEIPTVPAPPVSKTSAPVARRPRSPLKRSAAFYGAPITAMPPDADAPPRADVPARSSLRDDARCKSASADARADAPPSRGRAACGLKTVKSEADILSYQLGGGDLYFIPDATPDLSRKEYDTGYETNMESGYTSEASIRSKGAILQQVKHSASISSTDAKLPAPEMLREKAAAVTTELTEAHSAAAKQGTGAGESVAKQRANSLSSSILAAAASRKSVQKQSSQVEALHTDVSSSEDAALKEGRRGGRGEGGGEGGGGGGEIFPWDCGAPVKSVKEMPARAVDDIQPKREFLADVPKSPRVINKVSSVHLSALSDAISKRSMQLKATSVDDVENTVSFSEQTDSKHGRHLKATSVDDIDDTVGFPEPNKSKRSMQLKATSVDNIDDTVGYPEPNRSKRSMQLKATSIDDRDDTMSSPEQNDYHRSTKLKATYIDDRDDTMSSPEPNNSKRGTKLKATSIDDKDDTVSSNESLHYILEKRESQHINSNNTNAVIKHKNSHPAPTNPKIDKGETRGPPTAPKKPPKSAIAAAIEELHINGNRETNGMSNRPLERQNAAKKEHVNKDELTRRDIDSRVFNNRNAQSVGGEQESRYYNSRHDRSSDRDVNMRRNNDRREHSNDRNMDIRPNNGRRDQSNDRELDTRRHYGRRNHAHDKEFVPKHYNHRFDQSHDSEINNARPHGHQSKNVGIQGKKHQENMLSDNDNDAKAQFTRRPRGRTPKHIAKHHYPRSVGASDYALSSSETEADASYEGHQSDTIYGVYQPPAGHFHPPNNSRAGHVPERLDMHMTHNPRNDYVDASRYSSPSEYYREMTRDHDRYENSRRYYAGRKSPARTAHQYPNPHRWSDPAQYARSVADYNRRDSRANHSYQTELRGRQAQANIPWSGDWSPVVQRRRQPPQRRQRDDWSPDVPSRARLSRSRNDLSEWSPDVSRKPGKQTHQREDSGDWSRETRRASAPAGKSRDQSEDRSSEDYLSDEEELKRTLESYGYVGGKTAKKLESLTQMLDVRRKEKRIAASEEGIYSEIYDTVPLAAKKTMRVSRTEPDLNSLVLPDGVTSANELRMQQGLKSSQPGKTVREVKNASKANRQAAGVYEKSQMHKSKSVTSLATQRTVTSQARSSRSTRTVNSSIANPDATYRDKSIKKWTEKDVADWITSIKLKKFKPCFRHIDGPKIMIMAKQRFPGLNATFKETAIMQQSLSKIRHGTGY
ncbi:PREDICTED: uncharacterized protein LOC106817357 [Priapulus caudatus]|uniref:Uncharacterized protein LOC106817357 n=1 Tax=Priapulus caudatus TaxID=37621 RepID=A0ABM1EZ88_PRICU|nr:PREDICTED: uncharacterized protein LOC106817357 [Priapulus caudatus]XP_014677509.1 PREDICTED: uncharacterized protein LOC106817357 [Priapulus caudatus]XP_014677517.1 PREDICTED: uncharacterized protein LOC106817357 [Priapulus caudatus]XP_014677524.1 PREDICTED: uncharacterized protein LOC106817357 [Priapulus caudatus]